MSLPDTEHAPRPRRPREPELYMPAMPPLGLIHALETRVRGWLKRRRLRRLERHQDAAPVVRGGGRSDFSRDEDGTGADRD